MDIQSVLDVLNNRNRILDAIITGREAPQEFLDMADRATEKV